MGIYWDMLPRELAQIGPAGSIMAVDVVDRLELGIPDFVAPSVTNCLLVRPSVVTVGFVELFRTPWWENAGRYNCYGAYFDGVQVYVSMEGKYWMIEASYPIERRSPTVLAVEAKLVITHSPMAAAQIAKMCVPDAIAPFEWISYC